MKKEANWFDINYLGEVRVSNSICTIQMGETEICNLLCNLREKLGEKKFLWLVEETRPEIQEGGKL
jgi:hypothetical protein